MKVMQYREGRREREKEGGRERKREGERERGREREKEGGRELGREGERERERWKGKKRGMGKSLFGANFPNSKLSNFPIIQQLPLQFVSHETFRLSKKGKATDLNIPGSLEKRAAQAGLKPTTTDY